MKNIKTVIVIGLLIVAVVFLVFDKCGSYGKLDRLKGQYEEHRKMANLEREINEGIINEQKEKIATADSIIAEANKEVETKNTHISSLDDKVTYLERSFSGLNDKDAKINSLQKQIEIWKEKFSISQSIVADKDEIIFSLTQKYDSQLEISNQYEKLYENEQQSVILLTKVNKAQDFQIKKLKLTSNAKTGMVIVLVAATIYGLVK